ncbi:ABC transporter permease [Streptomyces sp. NPDC058657]|uniref:ABC transporter permease n=1 Tax=unclassified Streptomyces TaxID=2593676 RepID=UPI00366651DE
MSELTLRAPEAAQVAPARPSLRGLIRLQARQHRRTMWIAGATVAVAVLLACAVRWWWEASGAAAPDALWGEAQLAELAKRGGTVLVALPFLIGAVVAGPMIARELESGTYKVAWTQSVSPARWLVSKLVLPVGAVVVTTPLLVGAFRLVRGPFATRPYLGLAWYDSGVYEALGPVFLGYSLLGVTLGALIGLLVRRTLLAMAGTVVTMGALLLVMQQWRDDLSPMRTAVGEGVTSFTPGDHWRMEWSHGGGWQTAAGVRIDTEPCNEVAGRALDAAPHADADVYEPVFSRCVAERGGVTEFSDYHAAADFWPLQGVETVILLVLAAGAGWLAFRALRRLHG